jgi:hypothetical protein
MEEKMTQYGTWSPRVGSDAILLAAVLFIIAVVLAYLGTRLHRSVGVNRPGKTVSIFLIVMWCLSLATFAIAIGAYISALFQQYGTFTPPPSPITPVTVLSGLVAFIVIAYLSRQHGLKVALGSAIVGTIAAPMIFELPYDLIVMGKLYPPPATQLTLLFFLPLFLVEISSFALLTLLPLMSLSKYTLFALAAMFLVFAIWAWFGFSYPSDPISFALNAVSKVLSFIVAIMLLVPQNQAMKDEVQ